MSNPNVSSIYFKRRTSYAPLANRDLRLKNSLYLQLDSGVASGSTVSVSSSDTTLWTGDLAVNTDPYRFNPAIHINHAGYGKNLSKKGMVGYYLGDGSELDLSNYSNFSIIDVSNNVVYNGVLTSRLDVGFNYPSYQKVKEADFTNFTGTGQFRLFVSGMGCSYPFFIDDGVPLSWLRTAALGFYGQRCGLPNDLPHTCHAKVACHQVVEVPLPQSSYTASWSVILGEIGNPTGSQTGATITGPNNIYCAYARTGTIPATGGHHDAGDYGKYTTSVGLSIHHLVTAADILGNSSKFDNLGLPESNNNKSDLLTEAEIDADYLMRLQDTDGGFYNILRPKTRSFDDNVSLKPGDSGDVFIAYPKNTTATANAAAALAQIGSSPTYRAQFGTTKADAYIAAAEKAWDYLMTVFAARGRNTSYQQVYFYSTINGHDDNVAWAATELYLATSKAKYHTDLLTTKTLVTNAPFDPTSNKWWKYSWLQMDEEVGAAARSYALAPLIGKMAVGSLDATYYAKCKKAVSDCAAWRATAVEKSAYGNGVNVEDKSFGGGNASWWFSAANTHDIMIGHALETDATIKSRYVVTYLQAVNYMLGCNPINTSFLLGIGHQRPFDLVNHYYQNNKDLHQLPQNGMIQGDVSRSYMYLNTYTTEPMSYTYPYDEPSDNTKRYPLYDRYSDAFNVNNEPTCIAYTKLIAALALLNKAASVPAQTWKSTTCSIDLPNVVDCNIPVTVTASSPDFTSQELSASYLTLDCVGHPIVYSMGNPSAPFVPLVPGANTMNVDLCLKDGRRAYLKKSFNAKLIGCPEIESFSNGANIVKWWKFDGNLIDTANGTTMSLVNGAVLDPNAFGWPSRPAGQCIAINGANSYVTGAVTGSLLNNAATKQISIEAMIFIKNYIPQGPGIQTILSLYHWSKGLQLIQDQWSNGRKIYGTANIQVAAQAAIDAALGLKAWHHIKLLVDGSGYQFLVDGVVKATLANTSALATWNNNNDLQLTAGGFFGWIDEIIIKRS